MPNLLGTAPNQVPTNADLGKLAFMDVVDTVTNNPYVDTAISDTKPSLLLDFANSKTLDPRITYTRASSATYFDPNGVMQTAAAGVPRFDHDPVTGESKGFLIEEQRSNLLTYSDDFSNAAWTKTRSSITANTIVAPDGTLTGDKLVEDTTASATHETSVYVTKAASAIAYTASVYVKAGERTSVRFNSNTGAQGYTADFDLSALTSVQSVYGTGFVVGSTSIASVGNGWYRLSASYTTDTGTSLQYRFQLLSSGTPTYTGNGTSGLYIWGAQLEAGSFATSYIPTTSAQVTRSADAASITGANFSSWYRADEGTLYGEAQTQTTTGNGFTAQISDNSYNNRIVIGQNSSGSYGSVIVANTVTLVPTGNPSRTTSLIKQSFTFKLNDCQLLTNSIASIADTSGQMVSGVTQINIGSDHSNANGVNGWIKKLAYYPKRLSNAELQEMTQ